MKIRIVKPEKRQVKREELSAGDVFRSDDGSYCLMLSNGRCATLKDGMYCRLDKTRATRELVKCELHIKG